MSVRDIAPCGLYDACRELAVRGESPDAIRETAQGWADAAATRAIEWAEDYDAKERRRLLADTDEL